MSVFSVTLRALLLRPRTLALAAIPVGTALVALIVLLTGEPAALDDAYAGLTGRLLVPVVVAFVSLIVGVSAFSEDREDGTLLLLAATPLPRWSLVVQKLGAAWVTVLAVCLPATAACALLGARSTATAGRALTSTLLGVLLTSLTYSALFLLLSLLTRRAVLAGAFYIVLWEGTVASFAASADSLSIGAYGRTLVADAVRGSTRITAADVSVPTAVVVLLAVTVAATALASWRLPRSPLR